MSSALKDLVRTQGGLVTVNQLRAAGQTVHDVRRAVGNRDLRAVARGLYASGETDVGYALRLATRRHNAVASHQSAALLWGLELVEADTRAHVAVGRDCSPVGRAGVVIHRTGPGLREVTERGGVRLTTPVRTVVDLARALPLGEAVAVADSALRHRLVTMQQLQAASVALVGGPGRKRVAQAFALVDPLSGSVLESVCRVLFRQAGLAAPVTQLRVHSGGWSGRVGFAWPDLRLIVEVDGFAFHSSRQAFRRDRHRDNALQRAGWRVLRVTFEDVFHSPDYVLALVSDVMTAA